MPGATEDERYENPSATETPQADNESIASQPFSFKSRRRIPRAVTGHASLSSRPFCLVKTVTVKTARFGARSQQKRGQEGEQGERVTRTRAAGPSTRVRKRTSRQPVTSGVCETVARAGESPGAIARKCNRTFIIASRVGLVSGSREKKNAARVSPEPAIDT